MARNLDAQMDLFKPLELMPTDEFGNIQEPLPDPNAPEYEQMRKNFATDFVKGAITSPITTAADTVDLGAMLPESSNPTSMYSGVQQAFQSLSDLGVTRENAERLIKDTTGIELKGTAGEITGEIVGLPMAAATDLLGTLTKTAAKYGPDVNKYISNIADEARETFRAASSGDDFDDMSPALATAGDTSTQTQKMLDKPDLPDTSISPTMIGATTEPGRKAIDDYIEKYDNDPTISKEELYAQTGVYEGRDGAYRYELDTTNAKLTDPAEVGGQLSVIDKAKKQVTRLIKGEQNPIQALKEGDRVTLDSILDFPELYEAYDMPFLLGTKVQSPTTLRHIPVDIVTPDGSNGAYYPKADRIEMNAELLNEPDLFLSTLLHEVQHAVQNREGFTSGSNVTHFVNKEIKKLNLPGVADRDDFDTVQDSLYTYNDAIAPQQINDLAFKVGTKNPELGTILNIDTVNRDVDYMPYQALKNIISPALKNKIYYGPNNSALNVKKSLKQELTPEDFRLRLNELEEAINDAEVQDWLAVQTFEQTDVEDIVNTARDIVVNATPMDLMSILKDDVKYTTMLDVMVMNESRVDKVGYYNYARKYGELEARLIQDRLKHRKKLESEGFTKKEIEAQMREKYPPLDMTINKAVVEGGDYELSKTLDVTESDERKVFFPERLALFDEGSNADFSAAAKSVDNEMISVFPKPERMFPEGERPKGGDYLNPQTGEVLSGRNVSSANIKINPDGKPSFKVSNDDIDTVGSTGKGKSQIKVNLFKKKAGWKWDNAPSEYEGVETLVSVTHKGKHYYTLETDFTSGVNLTKYPNSKTEPRLRPTVVGNIELGDPVGTISVRGKEHPVYTQIKTYNKGGVVMQKQMELFNEGGLADEGGTKDPVSGNDVPVGSTQEEVRDDIPARLSEGEFVLPADVVRYHGLEKIMQLRDEAKRGLQKMEDMGQMGNSDEAILDDDIPFSIEDLEMEDDGVLEYNQGGVVQPQGFTGISGYQPSQFTGYQPQFTQYQAPQMIGSYTAPVQQAVPTAPQMTQGQLPTFESFVAPPEGQAPENREYINPETGERRTFVFIGGKSSAQIPEGFIPISDYVSPTLTETKVTPTIGQTSVVENRDSEEQRKADAEKRARIENRLKIAKEMGYNTFQDPLSGIVKILIPGSSILGVDTTEEAGTVTGTGYIYDGKGGLIDPLTGRSVSTSIIDGIKKTFMYDNYTRDVIRKAEAAESKVGRDIQKKLAEREVENKYQNLIKNATTPEDKNYISAVRDEVKKEVEKGNVNTEGKIINPFEASAPEPQRDDNNDDRPTGGGTPFSDIKEQATREDRFGEAGRYMNKGGDVSKQMKKSGLTSKK